MISAVQGNAAEMFTYGSAGINECMRRCESVASCNSFAFCHGDSSSSCMSKDKVLTASSAATVSGSGANPGMESTGTWHINSYCSDVWQSRSGTTCSSNQEFVCGPH